MKYIGIDISKDNFHVAWNDEKVEVFANSKEGITSFEESLHHRQYEKQTTQIGLESTGIYHFFLSSAKYSKKQENIPVETPKLGVSTGGNKITNWGKGYLGLIINQYKRICTVRIKKKYDFFTWQSRFHDHIIRSDRSLNLIREYIQKNPLNWENDKNNPKNLYI